MKKILFFTSVLFLVFATNLRSQTIPTITNVTISDSILCNGEFAELTIDISQSSPPTDPLVIIIGSFPLSFLPTYFVQTASASVLTINSITLPGLLAGTYTIRLVDPTVYYANNPNGNGTSTSGIYSVWSSPVTIVQPDSLLATTFPTANNECYGDCIAEEIMLVEGGTPPYSYTQNGTSFSMGNNFNQNFVGLCADTYTLTVTDDNGCPTQNIINPPELTTFYVNEPNDITPNGSISSDYNGFGVSCNGSNDGEITASIVNNHIVETVGMTFSPNVLSINLGDTVTFVNTGGIHNVNGTQSTFPSNPEEFGNSLGTAWTYSHIFTTPGVYNYQCDQHTTMGMTGTILVSVNGGGTPPLEYSINNITFSTNPSNRSSIHPLASRSIPFLQRWKSYFNW